MEERDGEWFSLANLVCFIRVYSLDFQVLITVLPYSWEGLIFVFISVLFSSDMLSSYCFHSNLFLFSNP